MDSRVGPDEPLDQNAARSNRLWAATLDAASEGMMVTDHRGNILLVNRAYTEITGYPADEVIGCNPRVLQSGVHDEKFYAAMWQALDKTGKWRGEICNRRKDGTLYPSWVSISAITNDAGEVTNYLGVFSDISIVRAAQQQLAHLAHHDPLTDLPNRLLLTERIQHAIEMAHRAKKRFALLFVDLDRFKQINDAYGHDTGDEVLKTVAQRMRCSVRAADTVARLGGDEFIVLLENMKNDDCATRVANKILGNIADAEIKGEPDIELSASIGIALYPDDGVEVDTLLRKADSAMYRSKTRGRGRVDSYRSAEDE